MNLIIAPNDLPFKWKDKNFKILECGIENNQPYAKVDPRDTELEDELKRRIEKDYGLRVYLGLNYICFIEDYPVLR